MVAGHQMANTVHLCKLSVMQQLQEQFLVPRSEKPPIFPEEKKRHKKGEDIDMRFFGSLKFIVEMVLVVV